MEDVFLSKDRMIRLRHRKQPGRWEEGQCRPAVAGMIPLYGVALATWCELKAIGEQ